MQTTVYIKPSRTITRVPMTVTRATHVCHVLLLLLAACASPDEAPVPYRNLDAAYVGIEACKSCHADKYASYTLSQMGRSWEAATLENSAADFADPAPVYDPHKDLYYQAFHRGQDLFIKEYRLSGRDTVYQRSEKIDYIVGSGQHTNSHIMDVGGYLYQMPMTWYAQDRRWDLPPGFQDGNNFRFDRPIPLKCITCHNAMPTYVEGSENKYDAVPHGIDCERCHGAGSVHIEAIQSGADRQNTIVNPGKLPIDLQFDICQGCHLQGAAVPEEGLTFADFRPGKRLVDIENVFWPRYEDSLRQFVMASHPDRLRQSECFLESRAQNTEPLTCITCHDPHVSIETLGADHYRQTCQTCHSALPEPLVCTETLAKRQEAEDNCVTCHMPTSGSVDIPHVRITDHFIRRPGSNTEEVLTAEAKHAQRQFVRLASLVDEDPALTDIARGYMTYYEQVTNHPGFLDSAAALLERARNHTSFENITGPLIQAHFLRGEHSAIIQLVRAGAIAKDAWTAYRIGEAFLVDGRAKEASSYLKDAVRRAPEHLRFRSRLAAAYTQDNLPRQAIAVLDSVLAANPKFTEAYNNRGYARVLLRDFAGAEKDFIAALALDPDLEQSLANLASLYFNTNRMPEARRYVQRLLERDPANPQYRKLWEFVR